MERAGWSEREKVGILEGELSGAPKVYFASGCLRWRDYRLNVGSQRYCPNSVFKDQPESGHQRG